LVSYLASWLVTIQVVLWITKWCGITVFFYSLPPWRRITFAVLFNVTSGLF